MSPRLTLLMVAAGAMPCGGCLFGYDSLRDTELDDVARAPTAQTSAVPSSSEDAEAAGGMTEPTGDALVDEDPGDDVGQMETFAPPQPNETLDGDDADAAANTEDEMADAAAGGAQESDAGAGTQLVEDAGPPGPCDDPDLVLCLDFEGDGNDSSPAGNHISSANLEFDDGHDGQALRVGNDTDVHIPESDSLDVRALTVEAWVRPITRIEQGTILDNQNQYQLNVNSLGAFSCLVVAEDGFAGASGGSIPLERWTHVACTYDEEEGLDIYVDGVRRGSGNSEGPLRAAGSMGTALGHNDPEDTDHLRGMIDQLRVWRVARPRELICPEC